MIFVLLIGFIVLAFTVYYITELVLNHNRQMEKIKRSDYICQKCGSKTPVVIKVENNPYIK